MPLLKCRLFPPSGLPRQPRFWNVVRVDPGCRILTIDPYLGGPQLLEELQRQGVIGQRAPLGNYRIDANPKQEGWLLVYAVGKKPTVLLELHPPEDRQLELFP